MDEDDGGDNDEAGAVDEVENHHHIAVDDLQVIEGAEAGDRGEYQCEVPTMMMMIVLVGCISTRCKVFFNPKKKKNFSGSFFLGLIGLRDPGDPIFPIFCVFSKLSS